MVLILYMVQYMEASVHGVNTVQYMVQYMEASIHGVNTVHGTVQYMEASVHKCRKLVQNSFYSTI